MFQLDGSNSSDSMKFNEIETDDGEIVEDVNNTIAESDNMQQTNVDTTTLDELTKLGEQRKKECE
jgi:hypothetical protein